MKRQVIVMGLGRFGVSVATTLHEMGNDEKNVMSVASQLTRAAQADATSEAVLKDLGAQDCDVAIVSMGTSIEASVMSTILAKKLGIPYVIARANSDLHGSILAKIGADIVVNPERDMGIRTAHNMTIRDATDYMPVGQRYGIAKLPAPTYFAGKKLSEIGFGPMGRHQVAVLVLQRKNEVSVSPDLEETVREGDVLIVSGEDDRLERLLDEAKNRK
jgi:trk system potassium uptake protein TrkA